MFIDYCVHRFFQYQDIFCPISRSKLTHSVVTDNTSLPSSIRLTEVTGGHAGTYAWSVRIWKFAMFFVAFSGITGCGSASLKLCVCFAASPWSQSPSLDSQWLVYCKTTTLTKQETRSRRLCSKPASYRRFKKKTLYFFLGGGLFFIDRVVEYGTKQVV